MLAAGAALTVGGCDAPWVSVAHADPMDEPVSLAPQYGAPPEWYERERPVQRTDAGVATDARPPRVPLR